jgi:type IV secretion system protein VirD4
MQNLIDFLIQLSGGLMNLGIYLLGLFFFFLVVRTFFSSPTKKIDSEKGTAHFAERREIQHLLHPAGEQPAAGSLLIGKWHETSMFRAKHKWLVLPRSLTTRHTLIAAPSGAGKSRTLFLPNLVSHKQKVSFIATDPKSELWTFTALQQIRPIRFAPTDPDNSTTFNWIPLCKDIEIAQHCAEAIVHAQEKGTTEPIWSNAEESLLTAIFVYTAHTNAPTPMHAYELLTSGISNIIKVLGESRNQTALREIRSFQEEDPKHQSSAIKGLRGKLKFMENPKIQRFTSSTIEPFNFKELRHKPTQIYWCLNQSGVKKLQVLSTLFFSLAILQLLDERGNIPVNLYLDEFANIGKLNDFERDITLLRGQDIAVVAGVQSVSQISSIYGPDNAKTIIENFNNKIILPGLQDETAENFAKLLGNFTYTDIRVSNSENEQGKSTSESYYTSQRQLKTADELRRLPQGNSILISTNLPIVALRTLFYEGKEHPDPVQIIGTDSKDYVIISQTYNEEKAPKAKKFSAKKEIPSFEEFEEFEEEDDFFPPVKKTKKVER